MSVLSSLFKVLIIGPRGSGKSSILCRMVYDSYGECQTGNNQFYRTNPIDINGKSISLLLKEINSLPTQEKTAGFIIALDSNNELDINQLPNILEMVDDKKAIIAINKADLHYSASFWITDVTKIIKGKNMKVLTVSAKTGENVKELMKEAASLVTG